VIGIHFLDKRIARCAGDCGKIAVELGLFAALRNNSVKVLLRHCNCAVYEVSEIVREIGVVARYRGFVGDGTVVCIRHFGKRIISHTVNGKVFCKLIGIDYVAA